MVATARRFEVTRFKSMHIALKELEPFVRMGRHLSTGRPFKRMGKMLSREALGNWLLCAVANHARGFERFTFAGRDDPDCGDGIIYDHHLEVGWVYEHVMVPKREVTDGDTKAGILRAVAKKQAKGGAAYARGKTLAVFLEGGDTVWWPDQVTRELPPHDFDAVWVVALQGVVEGRYSYGVTRLDLVGGGLEALVKPVQIRQFGPTTIDLRGHCPVWHVHIAADFESWRVEG